MSRKVSWPRRRLRMYIWKQWKKPRTRVENLMKLGLPEWRACEVAYSRKAYWKSARHASIQMAISNKRLDTTASLTGTSLCTYVVEPPCTERYARWCGRSVTQIMGDFLPDF